MSSAINFTFDNTLGATLIGFSVSSFVFGVFTTLVLVYFQRFPFDKFGYRLLVLSTWSLEFVNQVLVGHSVYFYTITNYGKPLVFFNGRVVWSLIVQETISTVVAAIVTMVFALRVWRFSNNNLFITSIVVALIFARFAFGLAYTVFAFKLEKLIEVHELNTIATLGLAFGLASDAAIAAALCFHLRKLRTGYTNADPLVTNLTIYAINTGVLTSAVSLCTLLLYNAYPNTFYFMASYFVLGKLYAISLLCTLNTRKLIRGRGVDHELVLAQPKPRSTFIMSPSPIRSPDRYHPQWDKPREIGALQDISVVNPGALDRAQISHWI